MRISARADFSHTTLDERALVDPEAFDTSEQQFEDSLAVYGEARAFVVEPEIIQDQPAVPTEIPVETTDVAAQMEPLLPHAGVGVAEDAPAEFAPVEAAPLEDAAPNEWRQEVAARLQSFKERRRLRGPRYPSLRLPFEMAGPGEVSPPVVNEAASRSSLAFELEPSRREPQCEPEQHIAARQPAPTTNIIEFPRYAAVPAPDELAEPVFVAPRILEAPETAAPQPALGGIILEPREAVAPPKEDTAQVASLSRRVWAASVDGTLVAGAAVLFGWIVMRMAPAIPLPLQLAGEVVVLALLWIGYQYVLLVYSGETPGLLVTGLELRRADGSPTTRALRRWRVLASVLSVATFGLGYAWAWFDEDRLSWHDRITRSSMQRRSAVMRGR